MIRTTIIQYIITLSILLADIKVLSIWAAILNSEPMLGIAWFIVVILFNYFLFTYFYKKWKFFQ